MSTSSSSAEWTLIEQAADRPGLAAAEPARSGRRPSPGSGRQRGQHFRPQLGAPALAGKRLSGHPAAALSTGRLVRVENTWRAVRLVATLATRHLPYQDVDDLVGAAHHAMRETMHNGPDRTVPDQAPSDHATTRQDGLAMPLPGTASSRP